MMIRRGGGGGGAAAAAAAARGGGGASSTASGVPPSEDIGGSGAEGKRGSLSKFRRTTNTYRPRREARRTTVAALLLLLVLCGVGPAVVWRVWEGRHFHKRQSSSRLPSGPGSNNNHPQPNPHPPDLQQAVQAVVAAASTTARQQAQSTTTTAAAKTPTMNSAAANTTVANVTTVKSVRRQFYERYGGRDAALQIYRKGVRAYGESLRNTAERLLHAAANRRPFVLAFAGYSVTVGRGNHYHQSFPFVLERILKPLARDALWDTPVVVRNAAIGGIPSFPYGFCFEHFLGRDADVVSWDYSMNEGPYGAAVLESYLRHAQSQLRDARPMVIVLDTNAARCNLLQQYAERGWVPDALCVGTAKDVVDDPASFKIQPRDTLPEGFRDWDAFGAPPSCPGRGSWHPKKQEHELIGWMLAMYFVDAVELALNQQQNHGSDWRARYKALSFAAPPPGQGSPIGPVAFPPPLSSPPPNVDAAVTHLLYGHPAAEPKSGSAAKDPGTLHRMHHVSCRTSFLPAQDREKALPSVVVSGLSPEFAAAAEAGTPAEDGILRDRTDDEYRAGWVLDVSQVERDTKRKVDACGGLGYVDMKIALYGVPESGPLRLWLPVPAAKEEGGNPVAASDRVQDLVLCEANEKRPDQACKLDRDLRYSVGGVPVPSVAMIRGAGEYLKRSTCVHVGIPEGAALTALSDLQDARGRPATEDLRRRLAGRHPAGVSGLGLVVDLHAESPVTRKDGACCLSHVVWEHGF